MTDHSAETTDQTIDRLITYAERLHQSVCQAKILYTFFQSLNKDSHLRERINDSNARGAINIAMNAVLRELVMVVVRVLDGAGNPIEKTNRVTFKVVAEWFKREPIRAALLERARYVENGFDADLHEASAQAAMQALAERLEKLGKEEPNREKLVRGFRDGFLAHELHLEIPRDPPLFGHIGGLLEEIRQLSEATSLAIGGSRMHWDFLEDSIQNSAAFLWDRVAGS